MSKKTISLISSATVMLVAIIFLFYSLQYSFGSELGPGAALMPFCLSAILLVLSGSYMVVAAKGKDIIEDMPDAEGKKNIFFIVCSMILYLVLLKPLGSVLSGGIFLFLLLRKSYKWHISALIAIVASASLFLLFAKVLDVNMPVNMFGF